MARSRLEFYYLEEKQYYQLDKNYSLSNMFFIYEIA